METTPIIKNILLPKLKKDSKYSDEKVGASFWKNFSTVLVRFEENAQPLYTAIYSLELGNPEQIIDKLPKIYAQFLKELAECYVLSQTSEATDYLVKTNNKTFLKEVQFLKTMQQAIKSVERKRIKTELPQSYARLTFELSETEIANAIKKKAREELKKKMKLWDAELKDGVPVISMANLEDEITSDKTRSKVISLSWMEYAVAASIIIAAGIFYFKNTGTPEIPVENSVVIKEKKNNQPQLHPTVTETIALASIETTSSTVTVLQPESLGFSSDKKVKITINFKDATKRILSLENVLRQSRTTDPKIFGQYKVELIQLKRQKDNYVFDGQIMTLFNKKAATDYAVMQTEEQLYYLKTGDEYYNLKVSNSPMVLEKVVSTTILETLEKIHFENQ
jgi:hypothetical protein